MIILSGMFLGDNVRQWVTLIPEAFPDMEELTGIAFKHFMDAMLDDGGGSEDWIN